VISDAYKVFLGIILTKRFSSYFKNYFFYSKKIFLTAQKKSCDKKKNAARKKVFIVSRKNFHL